MCQITIGFRVLLAKSFSQWHTEKNSSLWQLAEGDVSQTWIKKQQNIHKDFSSALLECLAIFFNIVH